MADENKLHEKDEETKAAVDVAFDEIANESVSKEDMKALDILKKLRENATLAAKVWCAYNAAKTRENIKEGAQSLSDNLDSMTTSVVGKMKEGTKLYDEYSAKKSDIIQRYDSSAGKIAAGYDAKIRDSIGEILKLKEENIQRRAQQYALKKSRGAAKKDTKQTSKTMQELSIQADAIRQTAMDAMKAGRIDDYQKAMARVSVLESRMKNEGLRSTTQYANNKQAFAENKRKIKENKDKIAELKAGIKELQEAKKEHILESTHEKRRMITDLRQKTGVRKVVSAFLAKFALNKSKKLQEQVLEPAGKWISEAVGKAVPAAKKTLSEIVKNAKESARELGLGAIDRLEQYVNDTKPQLSQVQQKEASRNIENSEVKNVSQKEFNQPIQGAPKHFKHFKEDGVRNEDFTKSNIGAHETPNPKQTEDPTYDER